MKGWPSSQPSTKPTSVGGGSTPRGTTFTCSSTSCQRSRNGSRCRMSCPTEILRTSSLETASCNPITSPTSSSISRNETVGLPSLAADRPNGSSCKGQVSGCCLSCAITRRWPANLPFIAAGTMKRNPYQTSVPSGRRSSSGSASSARSVRAFGGSQRPIELDLLRVQREQQRLVVRIPASSAPPRNWRCPCRNTPC